MFAKHPETIVWQREPFNAETPPHELAAHALTPADLFYVRNHGPVPAIEPAEHEVVVDGLVERPLRLGVDELLGCGASATVAATLQCAGNRRNELLEVRPIDGEIPWGPGVIGTAEWTGVPLAAVLGRAGVAPGATHVELLGADDDPEGRAFGASIPLEKALAGEVLLATAMNGEPLAPVHGAPLRAVVPGFVGARSVKWLTRIRLLDRPSDNHYQAKAYRLHPPAPAGSCTGGGTALAEMPVNAAILTPAEGDAVPAGRVTVRGYAITGGGAHIERVEVSTDGTTWQVAELLDDHGPWAWRRWRAELRLAAGPAEIAARALDSRANVQPEDPAQRWNCLGYANNAWSRVRVGVLATAPV